MTDRTPCRTPTGTSATNLPTWKFDACRAAILSVLAEGETQAREIAALAGGQLSDADRDALGKLGWHVMAVRLEMEVRGEIARIDGRTPVTLRLADRGAGGDR